MIRFQRSLRCTGNKAREATEWAKEVTTYLNDNYSETTLQAFGQRFGDVNTIVWQADFDSLASLDNYQQAAGDDEGYLAIVAKSVGLFVDGTLIDTVFETL